MSKLPLEFQEFHYFLFHVRDNVYKIQSHEVETLEVDALLLQKLLHV